MVLTPPLVAGYVIVTVPRRRGRGRRANDRARPLIVGAVTGAAAGAVFGAFVVFVDAFGVERVREVFLNISPALMDYLLSGRTAIVTAVLLDRRARRSRPPGGPPIARCPPDCAGRSARRSG